MEGWEQKSLVSKAQISVKCCKNNNPKKDIPGGGYEVPGKHLWPAVHTHVPHSTAFLEGVGGTLAKQTN